MIYITANTCDKKMLWQIQTQHNNFRRHGIDLSKVYNLVVYNHNGIDSEYERYAKASPANIIFIKDDNPNRMYIPSIKPYAYKYLFTTIPKLLNEYAFYCDQDVIFTINPPAFDKLTGDTIYLSDTRSYIGSKYILSKGNQVFIDMCDYVGINPNLVKKYEDKAGGCQIYGRNLTPAFWDKVEKDSIAMYHGINSNHLVRYRDDFFAKNGIEIHTNNMVQIWCSEMWTTLWNMWLFEYDTQINKELEFVWASNNIEGFYRCNILHNTGLSNADKTQVFNKDEIGHTLLSNIRADILVRQDSCTYAYYIEVLQAKMWLTYLYKQRYNL